MKPGVVAVAFCMLPWIGAAHAADPSSVPESKRTQLGLYLTAAEAHRMVGQDAAGVLFLDIRTIGEVQFLGMPAGVDANVPFMLQSAPAEWDEKRGGFRLEPNADFRDEVGRRLARKGLGPGDPVILICRSGDRTARAANLLAQAGYSRVYSVVDGFEGDVAKDGAERGRRAVNGWKNAGLPWSYELDREKMYLPSR